MIPEGPEHSDQQVDTIPDEVWEQIAPLLPEYRPNPKGGRPRVPPRRVLAGILYVLRTGCPWQSVPRQYGSGATLHRYYQEWGRQGIFRALRQAGLIP